MISNERQYRITKARSEELEYALTQLQQVGPGDDPLWYDVQRDAISGQLADLRSDIQEYEHLQTHWPDVIQVSSFEELPHALVKARIAAGLTQKELAERLGLKEQQIQRYEATGYASASLDRIQEVVRALGLRLSKSVFLPEAQISLPHFWKRSTEDLGLPEEFLRKRLLPRKTSARLDDRNLSEAERQTMALQAASRIERVFEVPSYELFTDRPIRLPSPILSGARFKVPARADRRKVDAYAVYAHYLALLVLQCTKDVPQKQIPDDARSIYEAIIREYGSIDLQSCTRYVWELGIPVLPLKDPGGFHGACWRHNHRNIIVLKQITESVARWIIDLFHELKHAGEHPQEPNFAWVETFEVRKAAEWSDDEWEATDFAVDVALGGQAEELADECAKKSSKKTQWLKTVVPEVAARHNVRTDVLANYLAYRMAEEKQDWWGAAQNLQETRTDPWRIVRDIFIEKVDCTQLNPVDAELLAQAISEGV